MKTTQQKGQYAQLRVELRATELGFIVSKPTQDVRYDYIIDNGLTLAKVQVKYCNRHSRSDGSVYLNLEETHKDKNYMATDVDAYIVYVPQTDRLYWIPTNLLTGQTFTLRFAPAKNNQSKRVNVAKDFEW